MRSRHALTLLGIVVFLALLITPFTIGEGLEPNDDSFPRVAYVFFVLFFGLLGVIGWGIGYYKRSATAVGLARYIIGNLLIMIGFVFIVLFAWVGTASESAWICLLMLVPLVWFGVVSARWHDVKFPPGYEEELVDDYMRKRKPSTFSVQQSMTLHGTGTEVSLPVNLTEGMYRLGYSFSGGVVDCEIFLAFVDDPSYDKRSIAVPESPQGGIVFSVQQDGRYVFEVDAVNDTGQTLDWELTVNRV